MPTISDYNSIPLSDGIKEHFGKGISQLFDREIPCSDTPRATLDRMLVSVNGKTYSIQELCTMAEAFQYLLKTPSKLEFFANTAYVNFMHFHNTCTPLPELNEGMKVTAKIQGIEYGTPEYTLLYIMQEYFMGKKQEQDYTILFGDTVAALASAITAADVYDDSHKDLKSYADGYGVLLSVNEAHAIMKLLIHLSPVKTPTP